MYTQTADHNHFPSVLRTFALSLSVAILGMAIGVYVPPILFIPLAIIEIGMLFAAFFIRRKKAITYAFLYSFTLLSGMTAYPFVAHYISTIGANAVLMALAAATAVFAGLAIYATTTKCDFSFLGGMLISALLAFLVISILTIFWPLNSGGMFVFSFIGVLLFSGFVLYDINQLKRHHVSAEEVPLLALNLYLDFFNLFLHILRIFGILSSND